MSLLPATRGEHSVKPYPCKTFIPRLKKLSTISGLIAAAPTINVLIFPPKDFFIFLFIIGFK